MELYGKKLTKAELRKRIGNMDQVAGIRLVQMDDGNERPGRAALFNTGSGLEFTVLLDRGMDIAHASYLGMPMGWRSSTGDVAPQYFEAEGARWLRSFYGGLLTTCGLMNVGSPPADTAVSGRGVHGRIGNVPARDLKVTQEWRGNDYVLEVTGTIRETALYGENLVITRTVSAKLGDSRICLRDVLTNDGFDTQPFQLLYHCNIGWPALDEGSEIIAPTRRVAPRDPDAVIGKEDWHKAGPPARGYKEQVYYHDMAPARDGFVTCAVVNKAALNGNGFGVYVRYDGRALPRFTHWKMTGEGVYVTGLEPCTCGVEGWAEDEKRGWLHRLKPGQSREIRLEFGPVTTAAEVKKLRALCPKGPAQYTEHCSEFVEKPV